MKNAGSILRASEVNALSRAAHRPRRGGTGVSYVDGPAGTVFSVPSLTPGFKEPTVECRGLNVGASDLQVYAVCEIVGSHFDGQEAEYTRCLEVKLPTSNAIGRFGVCGGPIAIDGVGRVHLAGVCLVLIKTTSGDRFADASNGHDYLVGNPTVGNAQILWEDGGPSSTTHKALVRFGCVGGAVQVDLTTARVAATANISTLSGTLTHDGVSLVAGDKILLRAQSVAAQNRLFRIQSGAWIDEGQPKACVVTEGTVSTRRIYVLTSANTYQPSYGVYG